MPEWLIVSGEPHHPQCDRYQTIDDALTAWDHLKVLRRLLREDGRSHFIPSEHDFLVLICDEREYPAHTKEEHTHDKQPIRDAEKDR